MGTCELLAPAKNYDAGKAAIDSGADAVYIAAQRFGAREAAGNSITDIERLARYAHRYYAKVYLTLNTILFDRELEPARKLVHDAFTVGCDAIIVQDMALLEMDLPPIPLFASTQTHNTTPEKVKFLQGAGFQRIILARELSLPQIREIRRQTTVDLEFFIHGALCVCYSGQCYLSQLITGRSANRGACAQPCRSTYNLLDASGNVIMRKKHLLSLQDLNLTHHLNDLLQAGITSFKIEGRLKNESYVKNIVAHYRLQLDGLMGGRYKKASSGTSVYIFRPDPANSFSRGTSDYFVQERKPGMASFDTAKAIGQEAGTIIRVGQGWFIYEGDVLLHNADGICFFNRQGELAGTKVNQVEKDKVFVQDTKGMMAGGIIYRNYDHEFEKLLQKEIKRFITVDISFITGNDHIIMTAQDEDGISVDLSRPNTFSLAEKVQQNMEMQLKKSGDTFFKIRNAEVQNDPAYFFPLSELNQWRRDLLEMLAEEREQRRERKEACIQLNTIPYPQKNLDYSANIANELAEKFYHRHGVEHIAKAFELDVPAQAELMRTKYCLKYELGYCPKNNTGKQPPEPLYLFNNGRKIRLFFDCKNCEMVLLESN